MKLSTALVLASAASASAFAPSTFGVRKSSTALDAEIRGPTKKDEVLEFGA